MHITNNTVGVINFVACMFYVIIFEFEPVI